MSREHLLILLWILVLAMALTFAVGCDDDDDDNDDASPIDDDTADDDDDDTVDDDDNDTSDDDTGDDDTGDDDTGDDDTGDDDTGDDDTADDDTGDDDTGDDDTGDDDTVEPITLDLIEGCNHFSTSDECFLPYPSGFFQIEDPTSETGVRVNYPDDTLPVTPPLPSFSMDPINTADGVSPAGPVLLHFGFDIHENFLNNELDLEKSLAPGNAIALFNMETGERIRFIAEMDMNRRVLFPNRYALIIRPMEPMQMGVRHAVVLTTDLTDDEGNSLESPEAFAVLRDDIPVTNEEIEDIREDYENLFDFLADHGYPREKLFLAWDFMVASQEYLTGSVLHMRNEALDIMGGTGLSYTIDSVVDDPNEYLARIVEGTFEVPTYLTEDNSLVYDEDHHPILQDENQSFPYTMIIPKKAETLAEPLPLVVFGHGLFGNGRDYLTGGLGSIIQPVAEEAGTIMIATNWIGLSDGDLQLILDEVLYDLNRIYIVTDRLQQSLINNLTMTELAIGQLSSDPAIKVADNELIDPSRVYYYGASLGGIQGTSFMAISNRFERGVMGVPGSVWLNMIPRSINWVPIKLMMDLLYPDPLVQQFGIAFIQTQFDHSDPINLSKLLFDDPPPNSPANRKVVLQEAIGDCQVPNMTTEMLARAIGVKQIEPPIYYVPGLSYVPSPTEESVLVQYYLVDQVLANPPPLTNVPPLVENGAHFDMCFMPHVLDQVVHFLLEAEVVQYCDGLCDPD